MPKPTIISLLKTDHKEVSTLFKNLEKATTPSRKSKIFAAIDHALSLHADFEEARVYPLLQARKASKSMALEAIEEHLQVKRLLAELRGLDASDDRWKAKATVLAENVRHHVKEEERDDLPELKKAVSAQALISLAEEYESARAENHEGRMKTKKMPKATRPRGSKPALRF